jgi:hypothetical protein
LFFRVGPGVFLVFNPQATQQEAVLPPHGAEGSVHVCFRVAAEELQSWAERLEAHGYPVTWAEWKAGPACTCATLPATWSSWPPRRYGACLMSRRLPKSHPNDLMGGGDQVYFSLGLAR